MYSLGLNQREIMEYEVDTIGVAELGIKMGRGEVEDVYWVARGNEHDMWATEEYYDQE